MKKQANKNEKTQITEEKTLLIDSNTCCIMNSHTFCKTIYYFFIVLNYLHDYI